MEKFSRIYAKIDLDAVAFNFASMKKNLRPGTKMAAVVKADGYGHGAVPIARMVEKYDYIWGFAVATAEEALALRQAGIKKPVLILGYTFSECYPDLVKNDIRPVVFKYDMACALSEEACRQEKEVWIHLGIDTGMSRIGFADNAAGVETIRRIAALPGIRIEGAFTHFARADETDKSKAREQLFRYLAFTEQLSGAGIAIPIRHCSNSAGIVDLPEANLDMVRAGISIYGIYPSQEVKKENVPLKPVMELKSHISYVKTLPAGVEISYGGTFTTARETRVATIPVGYADGYPRLLSNRGRVLIAGKSAPILGRVCMDQFMVDVTDIPEARELDEVTLLGADGTEQITAEELGDLSGRFPYELVCCVSRRVPRVYVGAAAISQ